MKNLILVTNDDGIDSPGLRAAAEAVIELGDVICVAPQTQQTSMSRAFPNDPRNGIISAQSFRIGDALVPAYGVHGSPALAVSHAVLELCDRKPALCISGINYGENLGLSVFTSGTIGAAFEADSYDIPAIAVSREAPISQHHSSEFSAMDWAASKHFISKFASDCSPGALLHTLRCLISTCPMTQLPPRHSKSLAKVAKTTLFLRAPANESLPSPVSCALKSKLTGPHWRKTVTSHAFVTDATFPLLP